MDLSVGTVGAEKVAAGRERILTELRKVIVGQDEVVDQVLIALFTGGHCLITGVPGLAKTLLIKTLADILDLDFKRIQFTPDIMPSDITGTEILDEEQGVRRLRFFKGPIFAQIILADEINRTPPKTQAALLEAMQEYHVTAAGRTWERGGVMQHLRTILDDHGRPMIFINWNTDMGDGWEWSNALEYPGYIKYTALAYRMGINEIVYALTH